MKTDETTLKEAASRLVRQSRVAQGLSPEDQGSCRDQESGGSPTRQAARSARRAERITEEISQLVAVSGDTATYGPPRMKEARTETPWPKSGWPTSRRWTARGEPRVRPVWFLWERDVFWLTRGSENATRSRRGRPRGGVGIDRLRPSALPRGVDRGRPEVVGRDEGLL